MECLDPHQKILKIEALEEFTNLEELNISNNKIFKMENLLQNNKLKYLNLSDNMIKQIEGINLVNLEKLDLSGNSIKEVTHNIACLEKLRVLKLARNLIKSYRCLEAISQLPALESLTISENPFCRDITYVEYTLFKIPKVQVLDSKQISTDARETAAKMFGAAESGNAGQGQQAQIEALKADNLRL